MHHELITQLNNLLDKQKIVPLNNFTIYNFRALRNEFRNLSAEYISELILKHCYFNFIKLESDDPKRIIELTDNAEAIQLALDKVVAENNKSIKYKAFIKILQDKLFELTGVCLVNLEPTKKRPPTTPASPNNNIDNTYSNGPCIIRTSIHNNSVTLQPIKRKRKNPTSSANQDFFVNPKRQRFDSNRTSSTVIASEETPISALDLVCEYEKQRFGTETPNEQDSQIVSEPYNAGLRFFLPPDEPFLSASNDDEFLSEADINKMFKFTNRKE